VLLYLLSLNNTVIRVFDRQDLYLLKSGQLKKQQIKLLPINNYSLNKYPLYRIFKVLIILMLQLCVLLGLPIIRNLNEHFSGEKLLLRVEENCFLFRIIFDLLTCIVKEFLRSRGYTITHLAKKIFFL
jgi:hypothetical protein